MNPVIPLPILISAAAILTAWLGWMSWRATRSLERPKRLLLGGLRIIATLALATLLLNPGHWIQPSSQQRPSWLVLVDRSASMNQKTGDLTRSQQARDLAAKVIDAAKANDTPIELRMFDTTAGEPINPSAPMPEASGTGTDIGSCLKQLLSRAAASGTAYSGILVLSDGRQTQVPDEADLTSLALRMRAHQTPLHAMAIGAGETVIDLELRTTRPTVTAFHGQPLRIPFAIESRGLAPQKPVIQLLDDELREIATQTIELKPDHTSYGCFEITAPEQSTRWTLQTPTLANEAVAGNNHSQIHIRLLESRTRVFLAEGAPYWDSKFLAQLLREQSQVELRSVHRLSDDRYFMINTGEAQEAESSDAGVFPETSEQLARYDLIIFGKNTDAFLNPTRIAALRSYVRDQGGAILFSRGKPTTSQHLGLEALEPVTWGNSTIRDFRFNPTADGAAAALFGQALPAPDAGIWNALPTLKDARTVTMVKPFSRILANARPEAGNIPGSTTPTLVVRRYGQGVTGLVNGDGLWKWDFYPEARELGNMYEDFWMQLIQWMASYSEFLPGQDFSLRLSSDRCRSGETITAAISFRGTGEIPQPALLITGPDENQTTIQPARLNDSDGHPQWRASFTPNQAGEWTFKLVDPRDQAPPTPETMLTVPAPVAEIDNIAADPAFLGKLCAMSNGRLLDHTDFDHFLTNDLHSTAPDSTDGRAIWQPSWLQWPLAILLILPLALEWLLRRRQGLA